jgi:hypothetical protein
MRLRHQRPWSLRVWHQMVGAVVGRWGTKGRSRIGDLALTGTLDREPKAHPVL